MMIDVHLPDEALAKLATLIAERLSEFNDDKLGAFLARDPADDPKPTLGYPAPPEPEVAIDPTPIDAAPLVVSTAPAPKPAAEVTIDAVRKVLATMDRGKAVALLQKHGASKLSDLPAEKYADLLGEAA